MNNFDINALSRETEVNVRTIRWYVSQKLLPPPSGKGPAATYGPGHRDRLRLIRQLQDAHQPLSEIKKRLDALDDAGVAALLAAPTPVEDRSPTTAFDYVKQVLSKTPDSAPKKDDRADQEPPAAAPQASSDGLPARSTWERIPLHTDIELHVRRPLARANQRRLEALLEQARRLFADDS